MPRHFFRVDGADQETGEETYLVVQANSKPQAEKLARKHGLLISSVRVAKPADWESLPEPAEVRGRMAEESSVAAGAAVLEPPPEPVMPEPLPPEPAPAPADVDLEPEAEPQSPPAPAPPEPAPLAPPAPQPPRHRSASETPAVLLACAAGAIVVSGVLALALALWPDNLLRNELQQIDFRLHQLIQTVVGGMLILAGLLVFLIAVTLHSKPSGE